jgi:hypothetical protein
MRSARFGFREEKMDHDDLRYCECGNMLDGNGCCRRCECEPPQEHRGSRALDADFREAAATGFAPMTPEEREAFWQKVGAVREGK